MSVVSSAQGQAALIALIATSLTSIVCNTPQCNTSRYTKTNFSHILRKPRRLLRPPSPAPTRTPTKWRSRPACTTCCFPTAACSECCTRPAAPNWASTPSCASPTWNPWPRRPFTPTPARSPGSYAAPTKWDDAHPPDKTFENTDPIVISAAADRSVAAALIWLFVARSRFVMYSTRHANCPFMYLFVYRYHA